MSDSQADDLVRQVLEHKTIKALSERLVLTEDRLQYQERQSRRVAAALLFVGSFSELVGFILLTVLGVWRYVQPVGTNFLGEPFASGRNYFPATVSEMSDDPTQPAGKVFFAFGLVAAVSLLMSAYPWKLKNVYIGGSRLINQTAMIWRQQVPPLGCIILITVTVTPKMVATNQQRVTTIIHSIGAGSMFASYLLVECYTLFCTQVPLRKRERTLRKLMMLGMLISMVSFGALAYVSDDERVTKVFNICCADDWRYPNATEILANMTSKSIVDVIRIEEIVRESHGSPMLFNTASGWALTLKYGVYFFECATGCFMAASTLLVWLYCDERRFKLHDDLPGHHDDLIALEEEFAAHHEDARNAFVYLRQQPTFANLPETIRRPLLANLRAQATESAPPSRSV